MFFVHTTPEKFENASITGDRKAWVLISGLSVIVFENLGFKNAFRPHYTAKQAFSNSSGLKSVFEKLRFRSGLVWTVGPTVEIKLRYQIYPA